MHGQAGISRGAGESGRSKPVVAPRALQGSGHRARHPRERDESLTMMCCMAGTL